ncbi:hypothetical protein DIE28_11765 [Paracoccus thiocyanatus]|uniref:Uncharacterized protein n=1 Tax=Paracoccus thiocyanatus TaxID=34006 RepID=A0A3D8P9P4_9RHOB|nr:hypothetical protein DIE28_11765 [Paracoccus thiocyanatus]
MGAAAAAFVPRPRAGFSESPAAGWSFRRFRAAPRAGPCPARLARPGRRAGLGRGLRFFILAGHN